MLAVTLPHMGLSILTLPVMIGTWLMLALGRHPLDPSRGWHAGTGPGRPLLSGTGEINE